MSSPDARLETGGFVPFYRSYTKTWVHAVATAGLTAFGTLTIVHRWFAALALASYVVPPIVLYLRHGRAEERGETDAVESDESDAAEPTPTTSGNRTDSSDATTERGDPNAATRGRSDASVDTVDRIGGDRASPQSGRAPGEEPDAPAETPEWHLVDAPTDATLRDAVITAANGDIDSSAAYAVGDGGVVLAGDGDEWTTVLEDGPAAGGNDLRGVDATADGEAVWVAGDSGAVGRIDAATGRHTDYTAPEDVTDNWLGVAVGGSSGAETVLLINGSGAVLRGAYGDDGDGPSWTGPVKPGSGSSLSGIALADGVGYCCDTNDGVFETTDGGESFERIGLDGADGTLTDVATAGRDDCLVSADDGVLHRYDGPTWTPERVADGTLHGVARRGERTAACAADGAVHEREGPTADWERTETDAAAALLAVSLGTARGVAVGEDGTVVARG